MSRRDIYYWKCDRPAPFHGTKTRNEANTEIESQPRESMQCELKCAAEIARTDGIDVLFVGPSDLQFDLKNHADSSAEDYPQCLRTVVSVAKDAGKAAGILVRDAADLQAHHDLGFTHIAVYLDVAILRLEYNNSVRDALGLDTDVFMFPERLLLVDRTYL